MARACLLLLAILALPPGPGFASEWGGIEPGVTTLAEVRERYGEPSKETRAKVEGYDTTQWIYEGGQAPVGAIQMTVDFGLLTPGGYKPTLVRLLKLEPKPSIFGRATVVQGWGVPDGVSTGQDGRTSFFYKAGLLVFFDEAGGNAATMIFSPPQPDVPRSSSPAQPASPAPAPR